MNMSLFLAIAAGIIILAILALLVFFTAKSRKETKLSPLTTLAFGFTSAGIVYASDRLLGYSLLGIGIVIAVIEIFRLAKRR